MPKTFTAQDYVVERWDVHLDEGAPEDYTAYLVPVTLDDGCNFAMNPVDGNPEGWPLVFPNGFMVTCPHGYTNGLTTRE